MDVYASRLPDWATEKMEEEADMMLKQMLDALYGEDTEEKPNQHRPVVCGADILKVNDKTRFARVPNDVNFDYLMLNWKPIMSWNKRPEKKIMSMDCARTIWYWSIHDHYNFSLKFNNTRANYYLLLVKVGVTGRVTDLEYQFVEAIWESIEAPTEFESREKFLEMWRSTDEDIIIVTRKNCPRMKTLLHELKKKLEAFGKDKLLCLDIKIPEQAALLAIEDLTKRRASTVNDPILDPADIGGIRHYLANYLYHGNGDSYLWDILKKPEECKHITPALGQDEAFRQHEQVNVDEIDQLLERTHLKPFVDKKDVDLAVAVGDELSASIDALGIGMASLSVRKNTVRRPLKKWDSDTPSASR